MTLYSCDGMRDMIGYIVDVFVFRYILEMGYHYDEGPSGGFTPTDSIYFIFITMTTVSGIPKSCSELEKQLLFLSVTPY